MRTRLVALETKTNSRGALKNYLKWGPGKDHTSLDFEFPGIKSSVPLWQERTTTNEVQL